VLGVEEMLEVVVGTAEFSFHQLHTVTMLP